MKKNSRAVFCFALVLGFVFSACKSKPVPVPPREAPSASLSFVGVEAEDPDHLTLAFTMTITNPVPSSGRAAIESWRAEVNGRRAETGLSIHYPDSIAVASVAVAGGTVSFPITLDMDMAALREAGFDSPANQRPDDCAVNLAADIGISFDTAPPAKVPASCLAVFPRVEAPVFTINEIAILKAELINTRFRVGLRIENPNPYPVELSAFGYELYGNGRLWADGTERNIIKVPGKSAIEGNLFLVMNFINMKRDLLDQIIRLEDVNYRFAGEARVSTGVEYLPEFLTRFDLSGYSRVFEN